MRGHLIKEIRNLIREAWDILVFLLRMLTKKYQINLKLPFKLKIQKVNKRLEIRVSKILTDKKMKRLRIRDRIKNFKGLKINNMT